MLNAACSFPGPLYLRLPKTFCGGLWNLQGPVVDPIANSIPNPTPHTGKVS